MATPADIKKTIAAAGLEVYRTRGEVIHLAERVRENLLMDAGVFIVLAGPKVGFVVRAQRSDFPNDGEDALFERARKLALPALQHGYTEASSQVRAVFDPGDSGRTIDTWCEVTFEKPSASLEAAIEDARFALTVEKAALPR
jgi:hypothetical protein